MRFSPFGDLWRFLILLKKTPSYDVLIGCHQRFHGVYAALAGALRGRPVIQLTITDPVWMEKGFMGAWSLRHACAIGFRGEKSLASFRLRNRVKKVLFVTQNHWEISQPNDKSCKKTIDVLYVGNLMAYKNISAWLRTVARVKQKRENLRAVVVGDRPDRQLRRLVRRLGLMDHVTFAGPHHGTDLDGFYGRARLLLLTSLWEGLPMVMAEAMAAGLPVIATNVGDVSELLKDGRNGYLVRIGDVEETAAAVIRLLNDKSLYEELSANARRAAEALAAQSTVDTQKEVWTRVFSQLALFR